MKFEWDDKKAGSNFKKHGISFELAMTVFDDPFALMAADDRHSQKEKREWIIGKSDEGVCVVIFTRRMEGDVYRLISARKANRKESQIYEIYKNISL